MISKTLYNILLIIFLLISNSALAEDKFIFESKTIEYVDNENLIIAKGDVKITSQDGIIIYTDESKYSKLEDKLFLLGNIQIIDKDRDIIIESNKIEYDKNEESIFSHLETKIKLSDNYIIKTSNLNYLRSAKILKSENRTSLNDKFNNKIETDEFIYFIDKKKFKSKNLLLTDKDSNKYIARDTFIDLNKNQIAAKDIEVYFSKNNDFGEHARLKGNYMLSDDEKTLIDKGIFTTCKPNDKCPPWSMQAEEVKHNKKKKIIEYKNAWLKLYDKPVFYFPKFFHPDPTVKRQSGFLIPSIATSTNSGNSIKIPYFKVLAENKDFTVTPRIYFNEDILIQNEYRLLEKNLEHISDFSIKKLDGGTKSHFFSNSKFNIDTNKFNNSNLELNFEKTSNDTYLKSEQLKNSIQNNQSLLNSFIKYEAFSDDMDLSIEAAAYEDLTKDKNSDKYQFILPSFKFSKIFSIGSDFLGNLKYVASGVSQKRETNITENYLINDFDYTSSPVFTENGFISNFNLFYKNVSKKGKNSDTYENQFKNENFFLADYTVNLPLIKETPNFKKNLSPKLSFRFNPSESKNIKSLDRQINDTNIFSRNRLGLGDSLEGGQSLTLGLDYEILDKQDKKIFSSSLGQIYRDTNQNKFPKTSKMQNKSSDIVGNITYTPNNILDINYNYSADNNLDTMNYTFLETSLNINNFVTSFEFLEENNEIGSESYFSRNIGYKFDQSNSLKFNTRRNRKTDLTEYYNLIYEYKNDCLVAAIEYNKNYYVDRDIKPNEEVFFSLTITPFTSVNTPNFNK